MDGYHLSNAALDRLGRRDRKGAVDTFDVAGYVAALRRVRSKYRRRGVYVPAFDRGLDEPVAAGHVVPADSRLVITEGNYLGLPEGEWALVRSRRGRRAERPADRDDTAVLRCRCRLRLTGDAGAR
jgi:pantothenate kinase